MFCIFLNLLQRFTGGSPLFMDDRSDLWIEDFGSFMIVNPARPLKFGLGKVYPE